MQDAVWTCDACASIFERQDHFKRHLNTHNEKRSHQCQFCGSVYKRGDALRRHWKSCSTRIKSGRDIPEPRHGGKEKHACDSCARLKKSCNGEQPCLECRSRAKQCTFRRLSETKTTDDTTLGGNDRSYEGAMQIDTPTPPEPNESYSNWDLGPQTFYPHRTNWVRAGKQVDYENLMRSLR